MVKKKHNATTLSKCCNAKVKVEGKTTMYCVCTRCHQACDCYVKMRKQWARNPKTQITPNSKCKKNKLTRKEIDEIRRESDF
jgi:hypothetical protein